MKSKLTRIMKFLYYRYIRHKDIVGFYEVIPIIRTKYLSNTASDDQGFTVIGDDLVNLLDKLDKEK